MDREVTNDIPLTIEAECVRDHASIARCDAVEARMCYFPQRSSVRFSAVLPACEGSEKKGELVRWSRRRDVEATSWFRCIKVK